MDSAETEPALVNLGAGSNGHLPRRCEWSEDHSHSGAKGELAEAEELLAGDLGELEGADAAEVEWLRRSAVSEDGWASRSLRAC